MMLLLKDAFSVANSIRSLISMVNALISKGHGSIVSEIASRLLRKYSSFTWFEFWSFLFVNLYKVYIETSN